MRKRSQLVGGVVLFALGATVGLAQQQPQPTVDVRKVMSAADWQATGLAKLAPAELDALNVWLSAWSDNVWQRARAAPPAPGGAPGGAPTAAPVEYPNGGQDKVHWLAEVASGGRLLMLEDGSKWEVESGHLKVSRAWVANHEVVAWLLSPGSDRERHAEHPYKLHNRQTGKWVYAKFLGM